MIRIKHINGDACFLITCLPSHAPDTASATFPGAFTILVDPWLSGPSMVWHSRFALTNHTVPACIESLLDLPTPDVILVSQEKNDHCNQGTLTQLPPDVDTLILGTAAAAKKIKSWKHFSQSQVHALSRFDERRGDSVHRIEIPALSEGGSAGEVTIALLAPKADLVGLHNALAVTYRAPSDRPCIIRNPSSQRQPFSAPATRTHTQSLFSAKSRSPTPTPAASSLRSFPVPTPDQEHSDEPTLSLLYSPHGIDFFPLVSTYASSHLQPLSALPLTALIHCLDGIANPWYLGGNICSGSPSGIEIAKALGARVWVGAHDEEKINSGVSLKLTFTKYDREVVRREIGCDSEEEVVREGKRGVTTELVELEAGEDVVVRPK